MHSDRVRNEGQKSKVRSRALFSVRSLCLYASVVIRRLTITYSGFTTETETRRTLREKALGSTGRGPETL